MVARKLFLAWISDLMLSFYDPNTSYFLPNLSAGQGYIYFFVLFIVPYFLTVSKFRYFRLCFKLLKYYCYT